MSEAGHEVGQLPEVEQLGEVEQLPERAPLRLPGEWVERALCTKVDPELFFPGMGGHPTAAKRICRRCPVQPDCLALALTNNEEFGVWGGTSEQERRRMRAKQQKSKPGRRPRRSSANVELKDPPVLPASGEVEIDRIVTKAGIVAVTGTRRRVGRAYAGRRVTLRLDGRLMHAIADGILISVWPFPITSDKLAALEGARPPAGPLPPPPLPEGSLCAQRRVHTTGRIRVAKQTITVGTHHAGKLVTVIIEDTNFRVLHGGKQIAVHPRDPSPINRLHSTAAGVSPPTRQASSKD